MPAAQRDPATKAHLAQFGKRLRFLRRSKDLSQEQLAHAAGMHRTVVGYIERGQRDIGISTLWKLSDALDVEIAEFFTK